MTLNRPLAAFAALNGAMAVALGAFAAHGAGPAVKTLLTTGAHYQIVHALLALACAVWPNRERLIDVAGWLGVVGGLVFALALWLIALLSLPAMGAVAPIGGVLMITAWLLLAFAAFRSRVVST
ncbi:DUF423 domain-containing protein [Brevundimonas sp. NPDC092305]|uniref:DUF423 domain-containing protein n=1 Tax=Brevundimonas sp. NPDC092305 TaxID=3363957 RepID=UPI00380F1DAA